MKTRVEMRHCVYCLNNDVKKVGMAEYEVSKLRVYYGLCSDCTAVWEQRTLGVRVAQRDLMSVEEYEVLLIKDKL